MFAEILYEQIMEGGAIPCIHKVVLPGLMHGKPPSYNAV